MKTVHRMFEEQAQRTPERVALQMRGDRLTYRQIDERSNQVARYLQTRGIGREARVGVHLHRSPEAVCAILGILKAGGAYVPVDPTYPEERRRFLLEDSEATLLITESGSPGDPGLGVPAVSMGDPDLEGQDPTSLPPQGEPDDLIYLLYTSGSTGLPKGVCGTHRATLTRFQWMWQDYPFSEGEVSAHRTRLAFVDSVWEMFGPLLQGIQVLIVPREDGADPHLTIPLLQAAAVTRLTLVPSLLHAYLLVRPDLGEALPSLKTWIVSGERLPAPLLERFLCAHPHATLLNLYGSTEVAGDVTCARFSGAAAAVPDPVPIGKPIFQAETFVLDEHLKPVPDGEVGELYAGGPLLARGYHRRPEEQKKRFLPSPFQRGARLFRTGDRARRTEDGTLYYLGRVDNQVKIRGFRIELEEVEAALHSYGSPLTQVAAVVQGEDLDRRKLVAFVAPKTVDVAALEKYAASKLPAHMVPSAILALDELPATPTGKLDRARLEKTRAVRTVQISPDLLPRTSTEHLLATLWSDRLGVWPLSRTDTFQKLGGDSLSLVAFLTDLRKRFGEMGRLEGSFADTPLEVIAQWVDAHKSFSDPSAAASLQTSARAPSVPSIPSDLPFDLVPFEPRHLDRVAELATQSFLTREPMTMLLAPPQDQMARFVRPICEHCLPGGLSFVALARGTESVVGYTLFQDHAVRMEGSFERPASMGPAFALLRTLGMEYRRRSGQVGRGEVLESYMTGAVPEVDGLQVALALEKHALENAAKRGYKRAFTICTNRVTVHIADELGFQRLSVLPYATFQVEGRAVFASGPPREHQEAVLFEKHL